MIKSKPRTIRILTGVNVTDVRYKISGHNYSLLKLFHRSTPRPPFSFKWIFTDASMGTSARSVKITLVCLILLSNSPPTENSTTRRMTTMCLGTKRALTEAELYETLCGCFHVTLRGSSGGGFVVLASLQGTFWRSVKELHGKNVRFDVYHEDGPALLRLGEITCKENTTQCYLSFENSFKNSSELQTLRVHLSCESTFPLSLDGPCHDCKYVELFYNPQMFKLPLSPRPAKNISIKHDLPDHVVYVVIILVFVVVCTLTCISFFIYQKRKSKRNEEPVECMSTEPLVSVSSSSQSIKELHIVDIDPHQLCSKRFRDFLHNVPKLSTVCFIDDLNAVNENMYEWAHNKLKTCDFIIVVLAKEVTTLFNTEPIDIIQMSPYSEIVKYFLSQMNSDRYLNHALRYAFVQFQPVEVHESFAEKLTNLSFKNVYNLTNLARPSIDNATCSELKRLLMAIGVDNCDIKSVLHNINDQV